MSKHALINPKEFFLETVDDFFAPWNDWFRKNNFLNHNSIPALNIADEKDHYTVTVAAPGLTKDDFDIEADDHVLTISATSGKEQEEDKKKYHRKEYSYSSFSRSFTLPSNVNADAIEASYHNGILTLALPKNEPDKNGAGKKVAVN